LILGVVVPLSGGDAQRAVALAGMMALASGLVCVLAGTVRLGFVTELLSKPIRYGYMNGIALTVLVSQLPTLFGFSAEGEGLLGASRAFVDGMLDRKANGVALALGAGTLAAIFVFQRSKRLPGALLAIIGAAVAVAVLNLSTRAGVPVLGSLPQGLPAISLPMIRPGDIVPVLLGGLAVALVSFADTSVLSRTYAARVGGASDPNQEMVALGAANLAAGLFQGIPISASASRTPVAEAAGAQTQLAGVVGAMTVAGLLTWAPNLLASLPKAALAAVMIASALALFEITDLRRIYRIQRWEFWLSIGCLVGVAVLGAISGIGLAIVIAVIEFLWDGWRPHSAVLGRVDGVKGYHDIGRYPDARIVPGLVLFRWDAPLFFANAELFRDRALDAVASSPTPVRWLVVGAEPITSVDVTSADVLDELDATLRKAGIDLCFAEMKDPVKDKLKRFGLFSRLGEQRFFATIGEAVSRYLESESVPWVDWEDRKT
jgi:MFS superfamily sulfate permease-like transporter